MNNYKYPNNKSQLQKYTIKYLFKSSGISTKNYQKHPLHSESQSQQSGEEKYVFNLIQKNSYSSNVDSALTRDNSQNATNAPQINDGGCNGISQHINSNEEKKSQKHIKVTTIHSNIYLDNIEIREFSKQIIQGLTTNINKGQTKERKHDRSSSTTKFQQNKQIKSPSQSQKSSVIQVSNKSFELKKREKQLNEKYTKKLKIDLNNSIQNSNKIQKKNTSKEKKNLIKNISINNSLSEINDQQDKNSSFSGSQSLNNSNGNWNLNSNNNSMIIKSGNKLGNSFSSLKLKNQKKLTQPHSYRDLNLSQKKDFILSSFNDSQQEINSYRINQKRNSKDIVDKTQSLNKKFTTNVTSKNKSDSRSFFPKKNVEQKNSRFSVKSQSKLNHIPSNDISLCENPILDTHDESKYPFKDQYNFEQNLEHNTKVEYNLEEIKKERNKLIKKISNTLKVKHKAPSTSQEYYKILHVIGKGAFAKVCLGIQLLTGKFVALKLIDKSMLRSEGAKQRVLQEVLILKKLNHHKGVIKLLEVFESRKLIFIVTEHVDGSDLMQIMKERNGQPFSEIDTKNILIQILSSLNYIHSNNVLHRDIKLDNILIDRFHNLKLIDFGISKIIQKGQKINEQCGTPAFLSPEIILNKGYEGFASDFWSLGIVLYILLYGKVPFKGNNITELHRNILNGILPKQEMKNNNVSILAQDMIVKLLQVNVKQRIDYNGIINHQWLKGFKVEEMGIDKEILQFDDKIINQIESFGYTREYIMRCLQKNGLSHVNAVYNVLKACYNSD